MQNLLIFQMFLFVVTMCFTISKFFFRLLHWAQFHQHFIISICANILVQIKSLTFTASAKSLVWNFRTKKPHVKCWWNWPLVQIPMGFFMAVICLSGLDVTTTKIKNEVGLCFRRTLRWPMLLKICFDFNKQNSTLLAVLHVLKLINTSWNFFKQEQFKKWIEDKCRKIFISTYKWLLNILVITITDGVLRKLKNLTVITIYGRQLLL
jgi:hypothetical protein